jgi:hypothetical protein
MQLRDRVAFIAMACVAFGLASAPQVARAGTTTASVTVPMQLELGRPYIDVTLTGPNGDRVKAHAYVDTGGGAIILASGLAARLGLKATGKPEASQGEKLAPTTVPALRIGGKTLALPDAYAFIGTNEPRVLGHTDAELELPGRYLGHYVVVFDYPAHTFTLADPDSYKPDGTAVKTTFGGGMPAVHVSVAGKPYGFLLDTGGQYCMVSDAVLGPWRRQHPDWPKVDGVYGPANMQIGSFETKLTMLRIAALQWGPFRIEEVGAASRPRGPYEKMMTGIVGTPVIGSIGGNVLRHFRVTMDYPARAVYLDGPAIVRNTPLAMVGIMLEPAARGGYEVAGTTSGVKDIRIGDELLKVDGHDVTQAPFSQVATLLSGSPGTSRTLLLQRGGKRVTVHARVQSIL